MNPCKEDTFRKTYFRNPSPPPDVVSETDTDTESDIVEITRSEVVGIESPNPIPNAQETINKLRTDLSQLQQKVFVLESSVLPEKNQEIILLQNELDQTKLERKNAEEKYENLLCQKQEALKTALLENSRLSITIQKVHIEPLQALLLQKTEELQKEKEANSKLQLELATFMQNHGQGQLGANNDLEDRRVQSSERSSEIRMAHDPANLRTRNLRENGDQFEAGSSVTAFMRQNFRGTQ